MSPILLDGHQLRVHIRQYPLLQPLSTLRQAMQVASDNPRVTITEHLRTVGTLPRRCDVIIVNSRGADNPWFIGAVESVKVQSYANTGLVVVSNNDHALTIGAAFNAGVKASRAHDVLFLGDDDYISFDLVASLMAYKEYLRNQEVGKFVVSVNSPCTAVDKDGRVMTLLPQSHTGLFDREWLKRNPFNETLERFVDSEMSRRLDRLNAMKPHCSSLRYHYGYHYRQHPFMVSGPKVQYVPTKA